MWSAIDPMRPRRLDSAALPALEGVNAQERFRLLEEYAADSPYDRQSAHGLCFFATVELACEAGRLGLSDDARFICWQVKDDENFQDHWALALPDDRVIDPTAAQVDGNPQHLRSRSDYPRNYVNPRLYPLPVVLDVVARVRPSDGRFPRRQLWRLYRRLFRHDAGQALRSSTAIPDFRSLFWSLKSLTRAAFTLSTGFVLEMAIARMSRLLARLDR